MPDERMIRCQLNPLAFLEAEAEERWGSSAQDKPTLESVLRFLCPADEGVDTEKLLARYRRITCDSVSLFVAPDEPRILDKLIWPLRNAKASYMVGNYLGTISLSGMVAEMVAILLWEITDTHLNGRRVTEDDEKQLFGLTFERLGQERKISVLSAFGIIDSTAKSNFDKIRDIRRRYLHLWSQDHDRLPADSVRSFHAAVSLVAAVIGQDVREGMIALNPRLLHYLDRHQDQVDDTSK